MSNKKNSELSPILNPKFFDDFVTPKEKEMVLNLDSNFLVIG
jgi:hypothetical protein